MTDIDLSKNPDWHDDASAQGSVAAPQSIDITSWDPPAIGIEAHAASSEADREALMGELHISFDGRSYQFDGYRYDQLEDAAGYARLIRARHGDAGLPAMVALTRIALPSIADRELMATLDIRFEAGRYRFEGFSYDRLGDAVAYAQSH